MTVLMGIAGCGGIAGIAFLISTFLSKKGDIADSLHGLVQGKGIQNLANIEEEQGLLVKKIEDQEMISIKAQEKIKKIQEKASVEIEQVLKSEDISKIHDSINDDWEDL